MPGWHNWVLDPRHPAAAQRLVAQARQVLVPGYDGLFLDTWGDVEARELAPLAGQLVPSAPMCRMLAVALVAVLLYPWQVIHGSGPFQ